MHELIPGEPLPRDGYPFPDHVSHDRRGPKAPRDRNTAGKDVARILDAHFARASALPSELAHVFHDVYVPIHQNEHIAAAAMRPDTERACQTGRWLVRHGTDRCAVTVGLALLAAVGTADDFPLIKTIALLSDRFGPLAAHAFERQPGGVESLLWLAERVSGWGRVYVVEALCRIDDPAARPWLLRRACDGDFLNGYFAGRVATVTKLHEALACLDTDSEMVDHVGRLLHQMSDCAGMGLTLAHYPYAAVVLEAHARAVGLLSPTIERYFTISVLTQFLMTESPDTVGCTTAQQGALRSAYLEILDRTEWTRTAREGLAADDDRMRWLADHRAPGLRLRAFPDREPDAGERCS
ncbi:hypothetical protein GT044_07160 [Streptomyces sp. SID335]|uniref:Uncharacterized protein n=1 Tax=Streptomyces venezuelae TaxID=54571 RepID=A0A5P2BN45_STRVZ|nr:hypothetical protein [Streptomyces sp. SID335]MYZ12054.1 hypothetical protein [Streptomyces sp. SID337]NDZ86774.1 hypothetical protein [Streptomyces sp. SID10115]NEA00275.1 hypothetical protein [Streptomyces sp. SID10116]NEB50583.1 hypothetical protein [Streptomyces sp. SID339]QES31803.1 hypothetical protein DEJ47_28640 [Streptomyces venezuelae]